MLQKAQTKDEDVGKFEHDSFYDGENTIRLNFHLCGPLHKQYDMPTSYCFSFS